MADEELLARARALVPLLAARAPAVTATRQVADETIAAFHQTGILRVLQPSRYGGHQASFGTFLEILDIYSAHTRTRKSAGSMTRKLSVTWSQ